MAKDTVKLLKGKQNADWSDHTPDSHEDELAGYNNIVPVVMSNKQVGFRVRPTFETATEGTSGAAPNSSSDRGRGLVYVQGDLWVIHQDNAYSASGDHLITGGQDFEDDILCSSTESYISTIASGSISNGSATYDHTGNGEGERHLSSTGAFASYTWTSGDKILIQNTVSAEDASNLPSGFYTISSKVDDDAILLSSDSRLTADQGSLQITDPNGEKFTILQNPGAYRSSGSDPTKTGSLYANHTDTHAWALLEDTDIPGNTTTTATMVRGVQQLNGRVYAMNYDGAIYNSDIDDASTWSAVNFISSERKNDLGIYLGLHRDHIVAFNSTTIEFFYDAGSSPGSPLQRRQDIFYNIGAVSPNAIYEDGDVIYFLGWNADSSTSMYKLENFQLTKITDERLKTHLQSVDVIESNWDEPPYDITLSMLTVFQIGAVLVLTVEDVTFVYIKDLGIWTSWEVGSTPTYTGLISTWTSAFPVVASTRRSGYVTNETKQLVLFTNGQLARIDETPSSDLADIGLTQASAYWYSDVWDMGTNERKRINNVRILHYADRQAANTSECTLSWSDGKTTPVGDWNTFTSGDRTIDLNTSKAAAYRCGVTRQRLWRLEFDQSSRNRIYGIEIDYDLLRG